MQLASTHVTSFFDSFSSNDLLFFDNSHRNFQQAPPPIFNIIFIKILNFLEIYGKNVSYFPVLLQVGKLTKICLILTIWSLFWSSHRFFFFFFSNCYQRAPSLPMLRGFRHQLQTSAQEIINSVCKHLDADSYNALHFQRSASVMIRGRKNTGIMRARRISM